MFRYAMTLAIKGVSHAPASSLLAVLTVALGIAACMTTLTLLHALDGNPLPQRGDSLFHVFVNAAGANPSATGDAGGSDASAASGHYVAPRDASAWLTAHKAVRQAAMRDLGPVTVHAATGTSVLNQQQVLATSAGVFLLFDMEFLAGHGWSHADDRNGAPVAVVDAWVAKKLFGTLAATGRTIVLNGATFRIVGVIKPFAPEPHFYDLSAWAFGSGDDPGEAIFVPFRAAMTQTVVASGTWYEQCAAGGKASAGHAWDPHRCTWLSYWVQLDTPAQIAAYRRYLQNYASQMRQLSGGDAPAQVHMQDLGQWLQGQRAVPDSVRLNAWLAASFLILCLCNVSGLLMARFARRSGESGVRRALGASRGAVFARCVLESELLCLLGGVLGLVLTFGGLALLRAQGEAFSALARLDTTMFLTLVALAAVVGVLAGWIPAWRVARVEPGLQVRVA